MKQRTMHYGVFAATVLWLFVLTLGGLRPSNAQTPAPQRARHVPTEARQRLVEGYESTFAGDSEAADQAFADVQRIAPDWVEGYRAQAESLKWRSQLDAEAAFFQALEHGADDAAIFLDLAIYARGRNDLVRAIEFLEQSLDRDPNHYPTILYYGTILYDAERYSEARDILIQAIEVNPVDDGPIQMLAAVLIDDPNADLSERDFYTTLNEASQATREGRYQDAVQLFERLFFRYQPTIEISALYRATEQPDIPHTQSPYLPLDLVLTRAGYLWYFYLQDIEGGLFFWELALEFNPSNPWAMINTARALYARNAHALDESNAFQLIDSAIKLDRRNPLLNTAAAEIYRQHYGPDTWLPDRTFSEYTRSRRHRTIIWPMSDTGVTVLPFITTGWAYQILMPYSNGRYRVTVQPTFGTTVDPAATILTVLGSGYVVDEVVEDANGSTSPTVFISSGIHAKMLHITVADHATGALQVSVDVQDEDGKWIPYVPSTSRETATPEPTVTSSPAVLQQTATNTTTAATNVPTTGVTVTPTATPLTGDQEGARTLIVEAYKELFRQMSTGSGDINAVVGKLEEAALLAPDWWVPYWAYAEFYTLAEVFDGAQFAADEALVRGGDRESRGRLYYLRMNAISRQGGEDFAAIAADAQAYIDRQPYAASGYHFLGYAQLHLGQLEEAEITLRHGLSLDPGHRSMTFNLVNTLDAQPPAQDPRSDYRMMNELNQAFRSTENKALWFAGAVSAAQAYGGDEAYIYVAQATHLLIDLGNTVEGMKVAIDAVEMAPDWALAHLTVGRGFTVDNDFEAAIPYFDRAFELNPMLAELHRFRLRAYGYAGQELPPHEAAYFFSLTSRHAIPWQLDPSGTTILPYLDLGAYDMPFEAVEGQTVYIRAKSAFDSISNPVLLIVGPDGTPLASAHNNSGNPARQIAELEFLVPADGVYTLMVGDVHPRTASEVEFEIVP